MKKKKTEPAHYAAERRLAEVCAKVKVHGYGSLTREEAKTFDTPFIVQPEKKSRPTTCSEL